MAVNAEMHKNMDYLTKHSFLKSSDILKDQSSHSLEGLSALSSVDIGDNKRPKRGNYLKPVRVKSSRMTDVARPSLCQRSKSAHPAIRIGACASVAPECADAAKNYHQASEQSATIEHMKRLEIHDSGITPQPKGRSQSISSVSKTSSMWHSSSYTIYKGVLDQLNSQLTPEVVFNAHLAAKPTKPVNSSQIFQKVMADMYKSMQRGKPQMFANLTPGANPYAARFLGKARTLRALRDIEEMSAEADLNSARQTESAATENAKRCWKLLRAHVRDLTAERRRRRSKQSWDLLRYTVKGMTNMERTRLDLYQRYGLLPVVKSDGSVVMENSMFGDRARSALNNQNNYSASRQHKEAVKNSKSKCVGCRSHVRHEK